MEKLKNLHLRHSAAQQAFMLRCVRSDCYEALHLKKNTPGKESPFPSDCKLDGPESQSGRYKEEEAPPCRE